MKYNFTGISRTQEVTSGTLDAVNEQDALEQLRRQKIRPVKLAVVREGPQISVFSQIAKKFSKPLSLKGLIVFTRQFSSLIDSGVAVVQCLDILYEQEKNPAFKSILSEVKKNIEGGSGLAEAMSKFPEAFPELVVRVIESGEVSGTLDTALRRIGLQLEKLGRLRSKVIGAMVYPCVTIVVAVGVLLFLLVKVIPEISKMYAEGNAKLPELTEAVLDLSMWVQNNYLFILGGLFGSIVAFAFFYRFEGFRNVFDYYILKVPGFGTLIRKSAIARFTRTFSSLVASGVPLLNSFDICSKLISNRAIRKTIEVAKQFVVEGKTLAQGLSQNTLFPPMVVHMVNIGEMTGRLDELMGKVADIFDEEVDDAVNNITGMIQPVLIVVVGGLIAVLLVAMYLPIFSLADKVSGG